MFRSSLQDSPADDLAFAVYVVGGQERFPSCGIDDEILQVVKASILPQKRLGQFCSPINKIAEEP